MSEFLYKEPGLVIIEILRHELDLEDQQVLFTNQKFLIPTVGIFIPVSYLGPGQLVSSANDYIDNGLGGLDEVQSVSILNTINIDIMGYSNEPRERKEEIGMALRSVYSQQMQEKYFMQIARHVGGMIDTSFLQDTKMITRFTTSVRVQSMKIKQKAIDDIYTNFDRAVPPLLTVNE